MTNAELLELARNRLASLEASRRAVWSCGDVEAVRDLDAQIAEIMGSISELEAK